MPDAVSWALAHLPAQTSRTAVVTGADSGIGLESARGLAALGARVVMACRDPGRAEAAALDIRSTVPSADLDVRHLDLADLRSVAAFAGGLGAEARVDVLINNAGVMALPTRRTTAQGFEMQLGVNALGHFALTAALLPRLLGRPDARVVWISSLAHLGGQIGFDDLHLSRRYDPWRAYRQSKLADLVLAIEMQRRLTETGADVVSVGAHPGLTKTAIAEGMNDGNRFLAAVVHGIFSLFGMPAWKGALSTLVAAVGPQVRPADYIGPDGFREIWGQPARAEISPQAQDPETGRRLWATCERLTGLSMLS